MTREEAIAILDGFKHNPLFNEQHFEALDMAISALSENKGDLISRQAVDDVIYDYSRSCDVNYAQIMEYIDKIPSVENKGEWIPVSERLPENSDYVLVTDGLDMFVAWHNPEKERFKGWHSFDELFDLQPPILAWQPLPEPYKKGGE